MRVQEVKYRRDYIFSFFLYNYSTDFTRSRTFKITDGAIDFLRLDQDRHFFNVYIVLGRFPYNQIVLFREFNSDS